MNIRNVKFLRWFGINGIVLWPVILYCDKYPDLIVMNHEEIHLEQIQRTGVLKFYGQYLTEYFRGRKNGLSHSEAYREISFEKEAYLNQHDSTYVASIREKRGHT